MARLHEEDFWQKPCYDVWVTSQNDEPTDLPPDVDAASPSGLAPSQPAPSGLAPSQPAPSGLAPSGLAPSGLAPSELAPSGLALSQQAAAPQAPVRPAVVESIAIVGLGLMGGSVALATRRASPGTRIIGIDRPVILDVAKDEGIVDEIATDDNVDQVLANADLVLLCLPVMAIIERLKTHADALRDGPVISDIGSTKVAIAAAAAELKLTRFVGGHPMAGKSVGGLANADPDLLAGATWFFCPSEESDKEATRLLRQWARSIEAAPVEIEASEHDRAVALTSQLPHILANALAEGVLEEGALDAAGGSLKQLLSLAGAPFEVWRDNLLTNQEPIADALRTMGNRLTALADQLDDTDRIRDLFARGRACRERLGVPVTR